MVVAMRAQRSKRSPCVCGAKSHTTMAALQKAMNGNDGHIHKKRLAPSIADT